MTTNSAVRPVRVPEEILEQAGEDSTLLLQLAQLAPAMLWVCDARGRMIFLNQQYLRFTGLELADALESDSWINLVHPDDRKSAMRAYVRATKSQHAFSTEYRLRRYDGSFRNVIDTAHVRLDAQREFGGFVGATVDITEQKTHEQDVLEAGNRMEVRSRELNLMYELKSDLQICRDVEETRPILKKYGPALLPQREVSIHLLNNSRDIVEQFVKWNDNHEDADSYHPEACWALRKGRRHLGVTPTGAHICPQAQHCKAANYLCLPMTAFGETLGTLKIALNDVGDPHDPLGDDEQIKDLERVGTMMADEIGSALEELRLRTKLHHQSVRDPLTGLYNRRYFLESFEREIQRSRENGDSLSLLMIDIDHFKKFNDNHGHTGGDAILKQFSSVLGHGVRGADIACRYGGEEFAVLMQDCPHHGAMRRADEIIEATRRMALEFHGTTLDGLTTSIGIASCPDHGSTTDALITAADRALYEAKHNGRDQIKSASRD